jgi:hypothetical protein
LFPPRFTVENFGRKCGSRTSAARSRKKTIIVGLLDHCILYVKTLERSAQAVRHLPTRQLAFRGRKDLIDPQQLSCLKVKVVECPGAPVNLLRSARTH